MPDTSDEIGRGKEKRAKDIQARSYGFGVRVLKMVRALPRDIAGAAIGRQVARSGPGIGSNVEEAEAAHSKREFIQKMNYARKEARETFLWLRMIRDVGLLKPTRLGPLIQESEELVKILTAIVKSARGSK
jgi:four helix bundle protein